MSTNNSEAQPITARVHGILGRVEHTARLGAIAQARKEVERVAVSIMEEMDTHAQGQGLPERVEHLDRVATMARELIRRCHREQMELRRELIRREDIATAAARVRIT